MSVFVTITLGPVIHTKHALPCSIHTSGTIRLLSSAEGHYVYPPTRNCWHMCMPCCHIAMRNAAIPPVLVQSRIAAANTFLQVARAFLQGLCRIVSKALQRHLPPDTCMPSATACPYPILEQIAEPGSALPYTPE